jgi:hypothetical protein
MQSNKDILLDIYSQSCFSHRIDDGKIQAMSQLSAKTRKQLIPKISSENWISVTYNKLCDSM